VASGAGEKAKDMMSITGRLVGKLRARASAQELIEQAVLGFFIVAKVAVLSWFVVSLP
jgi:hypothetical protein